MTIQVQFPGTLHGVGFYFADDTGSDDMTLFDADIDWIKNHYAMNGVNKPTPMPLRTIGFETFSVNTKIHDVYAVEVAFADTNGVVLTTWDHIEILVLGDPLGTNTPRVNGPWLRYKLHTSTAPTLTVDMGIFRIKSAIEPGTPVGVIPSGNSRMA